MRTGEARSVHDEPLTPRVGRTVGGLQAAAGNVGDLRALFDKSRRDRQGLWTTAAMFSPVAVDNGDLLSEPRVRPPPLPRRGVSACSCYLSV